MLAANRSWLLAALLASGCGRAGPVPELAPSPQAAAEPLRIQLSFGPEAELDLWVTDPAGETVYFANPRSNATGGALEADRRCGDPGFSPDRDDRFPAGTARPLPHRRGLSRALWIGAGPAARCPSASSCGTVSAGKNAAARSPWESLSRGCSNSIARRSLRSPTRTLPRLPGSRAFPGRRLPKRQTPRVFRPGAFDFRFPISRTAPRRACGDLPGPSRSGRYPAAQRCPARERR